MPPNSHRYLASLTSPPLEVSDFEDWKFNGFSFFWTRIGGGRLSEKRTGALFATGSFEECKKRVMVLLTGEHRETVEQIIHSFPSHQELYSFRKELLALHISWRRLTRKRLETSLNKNLWCGDLYVEEFPAANNARERRIINQIKQMQKRSFR